MQNDHKADERTEKFEADFRNKVGIIDSTFKKLMNDTQEEFLIKPSPYPMSVFFN